MRSLLCVILSFLVASATGSSGTVDEVSEGFDQLRETLVSLPDELFTLELAVHGLATSEDVEEDIANFRDRFATRMFKFVEELYEIELKIYTSEEEETEEETEDCCGAGTWYLGMNLHPSDNHTMDYTTGWSDNTAIGTQAEALVRDYLNVAVWNTPVNYIAIARHQSGTVDAVKVFQFVEEGYSMLQRFDSTQDKFFRSNATRGGPLQEDIAEDALHMEDDPIFSVGGDLVFNWGYGLNSGTWDAYDEAVRVALTGGHLSDADSNDHDTRGIGGHIGCNPVTGVSGGDTGKYEIAVIQDCPMSSSCYNSNNYKIMGTDHGSWGRYNSVEVYGQYALYVSPDATTFPPPGSQLELEMPCE